MPDSSCNRLGIAKHPEPYSSFCWPWYSPNAKDDRRCSFVCSKILVRVGTLPVHMGSERQEHMSLLLLFWPSMLHSHQIQVSHLSKGTLRKSCNTHRSPHN